MNNYYPTAKQTPDIASGKWDPEEFLRLVEQEKICSTFLVPTHFVRLLQLPEETRASYDLSSLKFICHGAAPVSKEVKRRMIDWLGPVLIDAISRDIEQHCRQRLASYQVPRQWVFEETLPRTETGKIKRREMRDRYRALNSIGRG